jgi:hypothetical protein
MGRCTLTHHGMNWEASPFLKKDFPGLRLNVRETAMSEEAAYKLTYPNATATWGASAEFPSTATLPFYRQIMNHCGYFAVCGAKGCIRACMAGLETRKAIGQHAFPTKVFPRPPWKLDPPETDATGGVAEGKYPDLYNKPDPDAGAWA